MVPVPHEADNQHYFAQNLKLKAAHALKELMDTLADASQAAFERDYQIWKEEWHDTFSQRTHRKSGKMQYTHKRLHSAMHSIDFYLLYLFTCQTDEC